MKNTILKAIEIEETTMNNASWLGRKNPEDARRRLEALKMDVIKMPEIDEHRVSEFFAALTDIAKSY